MSVTAVPGDRFEKIEAPDIDDAPPPGSAEVQPAAADTVAAPPGRPPAEVPDLGAALLQSSFEETEKLEKREDTAKASGAVVLDADGLGGTLAPRSEPRVDFARSLAAGLQWGGEVPGAFTAGYGTQGVQDYQDVADTVGALRRFEDSTEFRAFFEGLGPRRTAMLLTGLQTMAEDDDPGMRGPSNREFAGENLAFVRDAFERANWVEPPRALLDAVADSAAPPGGGFIYAVAGPLGRFLGPTAGLTGRLDDRLFDAARGAWETGGDPLSARYVAEVMIRSPARLDVLPRWQAEGRLDDFVSSVVRADAAIPSSAASRPGPELLITVASLRPEDLGAEGRHAGMLPAGADTSGPAVRDWIATFQADVWAGAARALEGSERAARDLVTFVDRVRDQSGLFREIQAIDPNGRTGSAWMAALAREGPGSPELERIAGWINGLRTGGVEGGDALAWLSTNPDDARSAGYLLGTLANGIETATTELKEQGELVSSVMRSLVSFSLKSIGADGISGVSDRAINALVNGHVRDIEEGHARVLEALVNSAMPQELREGEIRAINDETTARIQASLLWMTQNPVR